MRTRKRGKMDRRIPEIVVTDDDILDIVEKHLRNEFPGMRLGSRMCFDFSPSSRSAVSMVFQVEEGLPEL